MTGIKDKSEKYVIQCLSCETTRSIDKEIITELHKEIYSEHQFEVDDSYLTIKGHCKRCQGPVLESSPSERLGRAG